MIAPNDLEWCSLCGQHFTSERALAEHRHVVDDDSGDDDEQANSHGAGGQG